jgi:hypothetical protein
MKRLIMILIILAIAVPAGAKGLVLVYNMKQSNANIEWDDGAKQWSQAKEAETAFVIIEPTGSNSAGVFFVSTWSEKDDTGKVKKLARAESKGEFELITAQSGKKQIWTITAEDGNNRVMVSGEAKAGKIGTSTPTFASKLSGISIWDEEDGSDRRIGSGKITLGLNASYTNEADQKNLTGEQAMEALIEHLVKDLGYTESTP